MAEHPDVAVRTTSRPQARGARTRAHLLDATLALIARKGIGAFTARDVVAEAGSSLGVLTHHFPTRRDLVAGAVAHHRSREDARAANAAARTNGAESEPAESLADLTDRAIVLLAERVHRERDTFVAGLELDLEAIRDPQLVSDVASSRDADRESLEAMVRGAGSDEPELDTELLVLALQGLGLEWLRHAGDDAYSARLGRSVRRLIERFLAPDA